MESLQLAQMLADLSSLNTAEPNAAAALVKANKAIDQVEHDQPASRPRTLARPSDELRRANSAQNIHPPSHHSSHSPASLSPSPAAGGPARFDKLGRRILMSPPLTRTNSAQGTSLPGTPPQRPEPGDAPPHSSDDLDRASTLIALYEIRAKLKQQDNSSLMKAREKIADLAAKQQAHGQGQAPGSTAAAAGQKVHARKESAKYSYPR